MYSLPTILLASAMLFGAAQAADGASDRLGRATEQYAKCLDNALGNFAKESDAQAAARRISAAMLRNIRSIVAQERTKPNPTTSFWLETLGEEAFVGYLFKSFSDVSEEYRAERQGLQNQNNFDWRRTHQQLWSKYGCDAIHSQLAR
jgi:hypothetical protein